MDLLSIDTSLSETGVDLVITDIDGNETDASIKLLGVESSAGRKLMLEFMRKAKDNQTTEHDSEGVLAELTVDWKNITENGKAIKFSKEKAKELYIKYPILKKQVDLFVSNQRNFLKK